MLAEELTQALEREGKKALRPLLLVLGEESFLAEEVSKALRAVTCEGGIPGFNEDRFTAGEASVDTVLAASKMVPMMAKHRFVLVRSVDRWEGKAEDDGKDAKRKGESPLDKLAAYAADPVPSTVLVLVAPKLHGQRRIVTLAKKQGFLVACDPVKRGAVTGWIQSRAKARGHAMNRDVADHLADLLGSELGVLDDAVERLCLYVGPNAAVSDEAVSKLIAPVRAGSVWDLTDAVCMRDRAKALMALGAMGLVREDTLPTLGAIASNVRRLAKFDGALRAGESVESAGQIAGIIPFRVMATRDAVKRLPPGTLGRWLALLAETDVALKGGAKRGAVSVVETMVLEMCR